MKHLYRRVSRRHGRRHQALDFRTNDVSIKIKLEFLRENRKISEHSKMFAYYFISEGKKRNSPCPATEAKVLFQSIKYRYKIFFLYKAAETVFLPLE